MTDEHVEKATDALAKAINAVDARDIEAFKKVTIDLQDAETIYTLLLTHKPIVPVYSKRFDHYVCTSCSLVLNELRDTYCPSCGRKIAWEEFEEKE